MAEFKLRADANAQPRNPCDWFRAVMPEEILLSRLSTNAKLIASYLWARAEWREGTIVPTCHGQLMQLIGRSEKQCRECLKSLIDAGFMRVAEIRDGRRGGMEFRVFGPGRLAESFKTLNRPDGDQLSLWPFDDPEDHGGKPGENEGGNAGENAVVSAGFSAARAARFSIKSSVAPATEDEETTTSTTTSTSKLKSLLKLNSEQPSAHGALSKPGENDGGNAGRDSQPHPASTRAKSIDAAITERFGRPNQLQRQFTVLAALLALGHQVRVAAPGMPDRIVGLPAGSIESALDAALRAPKQDVSKAFYNLLRDRLRAAAGSERARMPHADFIREACAKAGLAWRDDWRQSSAELYQAWYERQVQEK